MSTLLIINLIFTILTFLMIASFVVLIVIGVNYARKHIPKLIDEFNDKKSDIDDEITKAKDEIIEEIKNE